MRIADYFKWLGKILQKPDIYVDIKRIELFSDLNSFQLYQLNNYLHSRHYKAGETIFEQGYPQDAVFFIQSGEVRVTGPLIGTDSIRLRKGDFIGIIDMFHEGFRSSTAIAGSEVTTLAISKNDLESLISRDRDMGQKILRAICRYLSALYVNRGQAASDL